MLGFIGRRVGNLMRFELKTVSLIFRRLKFMLEIGQDPQLPGGRRYRNGEKMYAF